MSLLAKTKHIADINFCWLKYRIVIKQTLCLFVKLRLGQLIE